MDYSQAFWPKSRSFFELFLLITRRCYEAEICTTLLPFRCAFAWYLVWPKSIFSGSGQKPWTIVRRFDRNRGHFSSSFYSSLEGVMNLKFCHSAPLQMFFCLVSCLAYLKFFRFWPNTMDYSQAFFVVNKESPYPLCTDCSL